MKNATLRAERLIQRVRPSTLGFVDDKPAVALGWYARKGLAPLIRGVARRVTFARGGGPCFIGRGVSIMYPHSLQVASWASIGANSTINAFSRRGVAIGRHVSIRENAWIQCSSSPHNPGERLEIGQGTYIGPGAIIGVGGDVLIGDDCQIGASVVIIAENHGMARDSDAPKTSVSRKGVTVGSGTWIGHRVTLVDGVELGERCIVGAGAVVTRSFPADSRIAGVPASFISERGAG